MKSCCTDHNGKPKKKYSSKEEAERVAQLRREDGIGIKVYPCEDKDGWHLTSQYAALPLRPINVMTPEERGLYTRQQRSTLRNAIGESELKNLRDEVLKGRLETLESEISQLESHIEQQKEEIHSRRRQIEHQRAELRQAEEILNMSKRDLSKKTQELRSVRRRMKNESN